MQGGWIKRYLIVVAIILAVLAGAGVWLKPPLERMREGVEEGLSEYAKRHLRPGEPMPAITHVESHDWGLAVSHTAKAGDKTFSCFGAFKVTICNVAD